MDINYYKQYEPLFGSWYITEKIGEGAYGQVYIIERHEMGVVYRSALKALTIPQDQNEIKVVMSDGMSEAEVTEYYKGLVQNIVSEFIMMSKLKGNSHVVSYEDHLLVEHEDDIGWDILIRMELLTPLIEDTTGRSMEEAEVIKLGVDLCKALEFCRKYDIIHRDIKPQNIFIAPSGDYKLGDFGVARTVEKTQIGLSRRGTYGYMAPEVFKGNAYGATVDIYSLGLVIYKLLNNNRSPFMPEYPEPITYDDREDALAKRLRGDEMPAPENGSDELKQIVLKACSFDAADRYQSASEMRRALEKLYYSNNSEVEIKTIQESKEETIKIQPAETDKKSEQIQESKIERIEETDENSTESEIIKTERKLINKKRIAKIVTAAVIAAACVLFALIPKSPDDIKGINAEETIYIGDTLTPKYVIEPKRFADKPIEFKAADDSVIYVNEKGHIKANKIGETTLTLSVKDYKEEVTVKVIPKVTGISDIDNIITLTEGNEETLAPKLSPKKFADEKITYSIKNNKIAKVSKDGKITAIKPGTTKLTINAGGYSKTIKIIVEEYIEPYVEPAYTYTPQYTYNNGGTSGSSSSSSSPASNSGSSSGFFDSSDDEYF